MSQLQRLAIAPSQLQDQQILLNAQQQHYLGRVLRLQPGDRFIAIDGQGHWWLAQLTANRAQILEPISAQTELPISVTLMIALPKGTGFDEVVRQTTELGVATIVPVVSERTLLNPSPQKIQRWQRIAVEAAEQSERQIVPAILDPVPFTTSLAAVTTTHRYICVARNNCPHLKDAINPGSITAEILVATGPEGGWTAAEVECAIAVGFQPVSLGRRILRAVTAPLVAMSAVAAALESAPTK